MQQTLKYITTLIFLVLIGCAGRKDMELSKDIFNKPSSIVITQVEGLENPGFYKEGEQGMVDFLISSAITDSVAEGLKKINTTEIIEEHYFKPFEIAFLNKSFTVNKLSEKLKREALCKYEGDHEKCASLDFRSLKSKHNAEFALVLDPKLFGTIRKYYGFIPIGAPKGHADLTVYLVRLEDNAVMGHYNASVRTEVQGDWDTPPDYAALVKATKTALATALNNAYLHFFVK